jgi:hypothetical protein
VLRRVLIAIVVVTLAGVAFVGLTDGYGADSGEAALAIRGVHDIGFSADLQLEVECADHVRVELRDDPAGSGLTQITVWGRPRVGRCTPTDASVNQFELDRRAQANGQRNADKFVDGATSQVVSLSS